MSDQRPRFLIVELPTDDYTTVTHVIDTMPEKYDAERFRAVSFARCTNGTADAVRASLEANPPNPPYFQSEEPF